MTGHRKDSPPLPVVKKPTRATRAAAFVFWINKGLSTGTAFSLARTGIRTMRSLKAIQNFRSLPNIGKRNDVELRQFLGRTMPEKTTRVYRVPLWGSRWVQIQDNVEESPNAAPGR
jgi:hypothetical protein